ncbi:MAG: type I restriction endonuclease subunit S, partial [Bacteroidetes bacterium]|nr:type I restriction endonuclease subunit S [Bacteroidota bacterium]
MTELEEEYSGEEGIFSQFDKINKATIAKRLKELKKSKATQEEADVLRRYLEIDEQVAELKGKIKLA